MTERSCMRYRLLAMTVTVSVLQLFGANMLPVRAREGQPIRAVNHDKEVGRIAGEKGLHEAARANGGTYSYEFNISGRGRVPSLQSLVEHTALVIVGTIQAG